MIVTALDFYCVDLYVGCEWTTADDTLFSMFQYENELKNFQGYENILWYGEYYEASREDSLEGWWVVEIVLYFYVFKYRDLPAATDMSMERVDIQL